MARDYFQRENLSRGIKEANDDDLILISDLDEIPNMDKIDNQKLTIVLLFLNRKCFTISLIYFMRNIPG